MTQKEIEIHKNRKECKCENIETIDVWTGLDIEVCMDCYKIIKEESK